MNQRRQTGPRFSRSLHILQTLPCYLFLLPVFFILHGLAENTHSIPAADSIALWMLYFSASALLAALAWFLYRDPLRASLLVFFIMAWHFFFGAIQDGLRNLSPSFLSQYRFLLPAGLLLFLALLLFLRKKSVSLRLVTAYLNILLLLLVCLDAVRVISEHSGGRKSAALQASLTPLTGCDTCRKPDIYLVLLDQYAGGRALKEVFHYDNSGFEKELVRRGFHIIPESRSNYNLTPFSMASTLNMDYLGPEMGVKSRLNVGYSYRLIRNSRVISFLKASGYRFYNHSVFDFPEQAAHQYGAFLPYGIKLLTSQTFTGRIARDFRSAVLDGRFGWTGLREKFAYEYLHFNDDIFERTRRLASEKTGQPRFVYAHLMLPHFPYYFNSRGQPLPLEKLAGFRHTNADDYIEYLRYGNGKILELVDQIQANSPAPPVILLLSDHGFRHPEKRADRSYDFMNLNAICLPGQDYRRFNDSLSNVNLFRVVFNTCFGQQLPLLKDSTVDLWD